jgi:hypothetical protein
MVWQRLTLGFLSCWKNHVVDFQPTRPVGNGSIMLPPKRYDGGRQQQSSACTVVTCQCQQQEPLAVLGVPPFLGFSAAGETTCSCVRPIRSTISALEIQCLHQPADGDGTVVRQVSAVLYFYHDFCRASVCRQPWAQIQRWSSRSCQAVIR